MSTGLGMKVWKLACVVVFLGFCMVTAHGEESSVDALVKQMIEARSAGNWGELTSLCDQILSMGDVPKAKRAQAKLYRVTAMAHSQEPVEKVAEEFKKLETDEDFVDMWPIHLRVEETQYLSGQDGHEEEALKVADEGIGLCRKAMELSVIQPDNNLWDRIFLTLGAKANAMKLLDRKEDAAEGAHSILKEADEAGAALGAHLMPGPLSATAYFVDLKKADIYFESVMNALGVVGRTNKATEVETLIKRLQVVGLEKVEASAGAKAKVKSLLLGVEKIEFEDKEAAKSAIELAKAYAEKF